MRRLIIYTIMALMTVSAMAIGRNDGSTKANAIDFDWDKGIEHAGGANALWYRVDLAPLYEEENPSLSLYLTNPSNEVGTSVDVSMVANVAGQTESKDYTIAARQYKAYTANASTLVRMKQTEIYLTLKSSGRIKLSAKVFEAADLDETCKDARTLAWETVAVQNPSYSAWWRVSLKPIKDVTDIDGFDAKVTITNTGSKTVNLRVGQSLDCPSSGLTKRTYVLEPQKSIEDTVPRAMINGVQPDEIYFGIENIESQVSIKVERVAQPTHAVIPASGPFTDLRVTDTIKPLPAQKIYRIKVADMNSLAKYEPEFTYRNESDAPAKVTVKMAFDVPAYGTSNTTYDLAPGEEEIVVYKKNMLEGMEGVEYIYLLTIVEGDVNFYGRFKHVREGKACKTNIDFNWESGHSQESRTTQWYAVDVAEARDNLEDIQLYVWNQGIEKASLKASVAFSCPYIDLQDVSRSVKAGDTVSHRIGFSSYAMMSDTVWIGLETNQNIRFWAERLETELKPEPDYACEEAKPFNWEEGVRQDAYDTVWYRINMEEVREKAAKFPTVFVQNLSATSSVKITAELSVECPDEIENEKRTMTLKANGSYSKTLSRNLFENIVQDEIYLRVTATQDIALQVRLNEEAEGTSCASAIPFNWTSGNSQAAEADFWYKVDLREVMKSTDDLYLSVENKSGAECKGVGQLTFGCPDEEASSVQLFTLAAHETKTIFRPHSALYLLPDSMVYINLQGSTSLRISAERVAAAPFTPIGGAGLRLDTLLLDASQPTVLTADTQWYLIPKEEILHIREMNKEEALTPNIKIENIADEACDVTIEAAFAFPVTETMIGQKATVGAHEAFAHALDYKLFMQAIRKNDSILVRITIPAEAANKVRIQSGMAQAYNGNTRESAIPIRLGERYDQEANTEMWYKINTTDWKKDKELFNKRLLVSSKNIGTNNAKVKVYIYSGLRAEVDMLEEYGLEDYRERTIKKGQGKSHDIPAQAIYGLGDVELYVRVITTGTMMFRTKFEGNYATITPDPNQQKAKLVVPNVDYTLPADTTVWYQICIPYVRNNYEYIHEATLAYQLEGGGATKIEITGTLQDTMTYKMPVHKRTLNKNGEALKREKPLYELLNKAIKKATGESFDISSFQQHFVDSMLREYITSDSLTAFVRVRSDKPVKFRINMPQTTSDECRHPMDFDWEHGNVNPAGDSTWLHVSMEVDDPRIPEGKDLMLHMDNWADGPTRVKAFIFAEDCDGEDLGSVNKVIVRDTTKVIERDLLVKWGWSGFMIQYYSDSTTHIWAEIIDHVNRDTVRKTLPNQYVCPYTDYIDSLGYRHYIDPEDSASWTFENAIDSVIKSEAKIVTYIYTFNVYPKAEPTLTEIDKLTNIPNVAKGSVLDCSAATAELYGLFNDPALGDTIMKVGTGDSIKWEYSVDGETWLDIPTDKLDTAAIGLRYTIITECGDILTSDEWINIPTYDIYVTACGSYTWPRTGRTYTTSTTDMSGEIPINRLTSKYERLNLTITHSAASEENVTICATELPYPWKDTLCTAAGDYIFDTVTVTGCDSVITLHLTVNQPGASEESVTICATELPYLWKDTLCTAAGDYTFDTLTVAGCDSVITLHLTVNQPGASEESVTICATELPYLWKDTLCTAAGDYTFDTVTVAGCDSVITLHLTVLSALPGSETVFACNSYYWKTDGNRYYKDTTVTHTIPGGAIGDCDSVVTLYLTVANPIVFELDAVSKYGNRLLMIDRLSINEKTGWELDSIGANGETTEVKWFRQESLTDSVAEYQKTGYYITNEAHPGEPLVGVYYAVINVPAAGNSCGYQGYTRYIVCEKPNTASMPALVPSMARPGEMVNVINLDPDQQTTIRVYTAEGLLHGTYTVRGENTFAIKAAAEHGFYLVELSSDSMKSTLRYIVK